MNFTPQTTADMPAQALLWFHFRQNNSGGHFIVDEMVSEDVLIQARNATEAVTRADSIFESRSDFCACCGERWSTSFVDDDDGNPVPSIYGEPIDTMEPGWFRKEARLHYFDGRVEAFKFAKASPAPSPQEGATS